MKEYEIWIGNYHLGQGHHGSSKPEKIGNEKAYNFRLACLKYELKNKLEFLENYKFPERFTDQDLIFWYKPEENANSWTGKYYETEQEALNSFK